jgi:hypothetical protein
VSDIIHFQNKEKDKNNTRTPMAITIFTLGIIFASIGSPVIATTSNTTGLEMSPQPIWDVSILLS